MVLEKYMYVYHHHHTIIQLGGFGGGGGVGNMSYEMRELYLWDAYVSRCGLGELYVRLPPAYLYLVGSGGGISG